MTIINQKSISGITSITFASSGDDLLTFHSNNGTERFRIDNSGNTKITAGIVTTLTVTGTTTLNGNLDLQDDDKILIGTGDDLQIYHDGSTSFIKDAGTGVLAITSNGGHIALLNGDQTENLAKFIVDDAVELYHNGAKKFETTSSGVVISGNIQLNDSNLAYFGTSQDLQIQHNGSQNLIISATGQVLETRADTFQVTNSGGTENLLQAIGDGAVNLYHNGTKKFETTSTGVKIDNSSTTDMLLFDVGGTNFARLGHNSASGTDILDVRSEGHTRFLTNGNNERLRIDSSGRVGIGTNSFNDSRERLRVESPGGETGTYLTIKSPDTSGTSALFFGDDDFNEGRIQYDHSNNAMRFFTLDGERARILSSGGITFNGDTASANALDDYEEGTWTPVDSGGDAYTQGKQATYTKIGRVVYLSFDITATASATGNEVKGLPFNSISGVNLGGNFVFSNGYTDGGVDRDIVGHTGTDAVHLFLGSSSASLANGHRVIMSGFYFTS